MQRRAKIGMYSDRVILSVEETTEGAAPYCLYRREKEGDFWDEFHHTDPQKLAEAVRPMSELAYRLGCSEVVCLGYGVLRYEQETFRQILEETIEEKVVAVSGAEQARAACAAMNELCQGQEVCTMGVHSADLSTQLFGNLDGQLWQESFPLGWRNFASSTDGRLIPDRLEEEQMRRKILALLRQTSCPHHHQSVQLMASGFDAVSRFLQLLSGSSGRTGERLCLDREVFGQLFWLLRDPSLRWLGALEQAAGQFPQKVFVQLLILETLMSFLNVRQVQFCQLCLEDYLCREEKICLGEF